MSFYLMLSVNEDILRKDGKQTVDITIDFNNKEQKCYESLWLSSTVWLPSFKKKNAICVHQKKETHTSLEQLEAK